MNNKRRYIAIPLFIVLVFCNAKAQSRLVMNNNVYLVMQNGSQLVIGDSNPANLVTTGTGGNIVSENEYNIIKWVIGTTTGSYTIPFTTNTGIKIPLLIHLAVPGSGTGYCNFSTYGGNWNNFSYMPTDVTHMNGLYSGTDNSNNTIDRFWIIDLLGYSIKPEGTLTFTYNDNEHTAAGNSITEAELKAQRFNSSLEKWGDYLPAGSLNTSSNTLTVVPFTNADFFRSWTLSESTNPLPVELLYAGLQCNNNQAKLVWQTASETNNAYFLIEGSQDGVTYTYLDQLAGGGTINTLRSYELNLSSEYAYYRLSQIDFDGSLEELKVLYNTCRETHAFQLWQSNQTGKVHLNYLSKGTLDVLVMDVQGKIMESFSRPVQEDNTELVLPPIGSNGIYLLRVVNNQQSKTIKLIR